KQPRGGTAAGHAVPAGIVEDDKVDTARHLRLGRKTRAGASPDDRLALRDHGAELLQDLPARNGWHGDFPPVRRKSGMHRSFLPSRHPRKVPFTRLARKPLQIFETCVSY